MVADLLSPKRVWMEVQDKADSDSCDVIVQMENGAYYTAVFVTLPYLQRQMDLGYEVSKQLPDAAPVRYATLETPHVLVDQLAHDVIEDTIDNLIALDTFESLFTQLTDTEGDEVVNRLERRGKRATAEVAAVVMREVLLVEEATPSTTITVA
ncbi:MAG: hypothetical protein SF162_10020 [bacterium]|nr:hypothetical protein [bacterium]